MLFRRGQRKKAGETTRIQAQDQDEAARFTLDNEADILRALDDMARMKVQVTLFAEPDLHLASEVLSLDREAGVALFDFSGDSEANELLLDGRAVDFVGEVRGVKVQFLSRVTGSREHEGFPAFEVPFPDKLLRLQRREFYRLALRGNERVPCWLEGGRGGYKVDIVDISGGGIGLLDANPGVRLEEGMRLMGCEIELPELGIVYVDLEIRNAYEVTLKNGAKGMRAGCAFLNLPPRLNNRLERFIHQRDRLNKR